MAEQPPPPSGQPPSSYQPPPPSNPNPLIPQGSQYGKNILSGVNPRIWVGAVIVIVVIAALLFWSSQQRGADTADQADRVALEQTSTQNAAIFITLTFSAITPTIDPKFAALETQNALLAQNLTDQAATSQAQSQVAQATQPPVVVVQATQPPVVVIPPTAQVLIVTATNNSTTNNDSVAATCLGLGDLSQLGTLQKELYGAGNALAGAVVKFTQSWTAPVGYVVQRNGQEVTTVQSGDLASVWSPETCYPLNRQGITVSSTNNQVDQSCLPKADFVAIINRWHEADKSNPSPAIKDLDAKFDQAGQPIGEQWRQPPYTISQGQSGSVVFWSNIATTSLSKVSPNGVIENLFLTGNYGIFGAWDTDVIIQTAGRSAWLCERLDPANDFPWWGK